MDHSPVYARATICEMQENKSKYSLHVYSDLSYIYNCLGQACATEKKLSHQLGNFLIRLEILDNGNKQYVLTSTRRDEHTYFLLPVKNDTLRQILELARKPERLYMLGILHSGAHSEYFKERAVVITHKEEKESDEERKERLLKQIHGKLDDLTTTQLASLMNNLQ